MNSHTLVYSEDLLIILALVLYSVILRIFGTQGNTYFGGPYLEQL